MTPTHRRWTKRRPRTVTVSLCDVIVWAAFTAATIVVLLACCALLWAAS